MKLGKKEVVVDVIGVTSGKMPSIGQHKYPKHTLTKCVDWAEIIFEEKISRRDVLSEHLGHSTTESGAFTSKITSLSRYGLLNSSRGGLELTGLGTRVASPKPGSSEREKALDQAARAVPVIENMYDRLGGQPLGETEWHHVVEATGVERQEAQDEIGKLRKIYNDARAYIAEDPKGEKGSEARADPSAESPESDRRPSGPSESDVEFAEVSLGDEGYARIPKEDQETSAKRLIAVIRAVAGLDDEA